MKAKKYSVAYVKRLQRMIEIRDSKIEQLYDEIAMAAADIERTDGMLHSLPRLRRCDVMLGNEETWMEKINDADKLRLYAVEKIRSIG